MSATTDKYEHIQEGGDYSHSYANAEYYSSPEFEGQLKEHYNRKQIQDLLYSVVVKEILENFSQKLPEGLKLEDLINATEEERALMINKSVNYTGDIRDIDMKLLAQLAYGTKLFDEKMTALIELVDMKNIGSDQLKAVCKHLQKILLLDPKTDTLRGVTSYQKKLDLIKEYPISDGNDFKRIINYFIRGYKDRQITKKDKKAYKASAGQVTKLYTTVDKNIEDVFKQNYPQLMLLFHYIFRLDKLQEMDMSIVKKECVDLGISFPFEADKWSEFTKQDKELLSHFLWSFNKVAVQAFKHNLLDGNESSYLKLQKVQQNVENLAAQITLQQKSNGLFNQLELLQQQREEARLSTLKKDTIQLQDKSRAQIAHTLALSAVRNSEEALLMEQRAQGKQEKERMDMTANTVNLLVLKIHGEINTEELVDIVRQYNELTNRYLEKGIVISEPSKALQTAMQAFNTAVNYYLEHTLIAQEYPNIYAILQFDVEKTKIRYKDGVICQTALHNFMDSSKILTPIKKELESLGFGEYNEPYIHYSTQAEEFYNYLVSIKPGIIQNIKNELSISKKEIPLINSIVALIAEIKSDISSDRLAEIQQEFKDICSTNLKNNDKGIVSKKTKEVINQFHEAIEAYKEKPFIDKINALISKITSSASTDEVKMIIKDFNKLCFTDLKDNNEKVISKNIQKVIDSFNKIVDMYIENTLFHDKYPVFYGILHDHHKTTSFDIVIKEIEVIGLPFNTADGKINIGVLKEFLNTHKKFIIEKLKQEFVHGVSEKV